MGARHRAEATRGRAVLAVVAVAIAAVLVALFRWAAPAGEVTRVADEQVSPSPAAPSDASGGPASDATATDEASARALGNFQQGMQIKRLKPTCSQVPVSTSITVLSYNIKSGHRGGLGAIASVIRGSGADVVLLQEVDRNRHSSGRVDQAAWLASNLGGWSHAFGQNVSHGGSAGYGTAIVSRWPIVSSQNRHLPNGPGGQQRGLLNAVVDIDGMAVSFYSTHLQNRIDRLKVAQARSIAGIVAGDGRPKIIGGDMNSWPGDTPAGILRSQFTDTWSVVGRGAGATNPAPNPRGRIDYLMHDGAAIRPTSADVLPAQASDHRAVRASYALDGVTEKRCTTPGA
ncbi:endonuclease/exonuclease/phosphatase family protein [Nocardioides panacisoli]|uniref:endonuclease/exonuclease/phosphatase family protein n=1 Tax=Nocardioides panacisoli TaxID=627624 RepID=UPI001C62DB64|nr:endonuclease/exonuclease/phosphatase family protein [Nocardioides panacisoli]QYJ02479.1 endonuclease/exonuclease/phosphatase family protein [Nocardioides panacisoli]